MQKRHEHSEAEADAFAKDKAAKQVGTIVHGGGSNHEAFEEEAEALQGLTVIRCKGHSRLYKLPQA